jgi:hypothetical protein
MKNQDIKNQVQSKTEDPFAVRANYGLRPMRTALIAGALVCLWALPAVRAVVPAPDGGYANFNTAEGTDALFNLIGGWANTALGWRALFNTTGASLSDGGSNTAVGSGAMLRNTTGSFNTATGRRALYYNTTGENNVAIGFSALEGNTEAGHNTAVGATALFSNTHGEYNTALGDSALYSNSTGDSNIAIGEYALYLNSTGTGNIALGGNAGSNLTVENNNIDICNLGAVNDYGVIRIGTTNVQAQTYIAGIFNAVIPGGMTVYCDGAGHLGTIKPSSARFKENIKPMDKTSEGILALKPVTFRYKQAADSAGLPEFGLIAEEVEKVDPHLVIRDEQGKPLTVRYEAVNAMLLNEFLKEHRRVQALEQTVLEAQKAISSLTTSLHEQALQIQKVNAQLATHDATPRVVSYETGGWEASRSNTNQE